MSVKSSVSYAGRLGFGLLTPDAVRAFMTSGASRRDIATMVSWWCRGKPAATDPLYLPRSQQRNRYLLVCK
jgi:hypothetical protein